MKFERTMNIFFYIITCICVALAFGCFFNFLETKTYFSDIIAIILLGFYAFTYECHMKMKEYIYKKYYVEKEEFDLISKELLRISEENEILKKEKERK